MKSGKQQTMSASENGLFVHIPYRPVPKGRPRRSANGGMFTDKRTREFEKLVSLYCKEAMAIAKKSPLTGPLRCEVHLEDDECSIMVVQCGGEKSKLRGDIDNYIKAILDGANGILFEDDKQIQFLIGEKT